MYFLILDVAFVQKHKAAAALASGSIHFNLVKFLLLSSRPENCHANSTEHSVTESCLRLSHSLLQKLDPIPEQSLKVYFTDQSKIRNSSLKKKKKDLYFGSDAVSDILARVLICKEPCAFKNLRVFALALSQCVFGTNANQPHSDLPSQLSPQKSVCPPSVTICWAMNE